MWSGLVESPLIKPKDKHKVKKNSLKKQVMENRKNQLQILLPQWCVNTGLHPSASGACLSQNGKQILKKFDKGIRRVENGCMETGYYQNTRAFI